MNRLYTSYKDAEDACDMIAGDNELHMAVVERFDLEGPDEFAAVVLNWDEAVAHVEAHEGDAEIIHDADHTPAHRATLY